ncbi:MAG: AAA family ATPase [Deltaproteobacteria bacterium]|nr:AAA family ATPase [Deltaproteobacteria bacterium]
MKILRIHFKNLNSLKGEWLIDLSHPVFGSGGIFLITGPTGAGKSTILDAICLALYGRTPRLGKITKNANEILSRRCGECFAEVTFETAQGRYRCHWSQRRAHKKANGELQAPRHEIADDRTGTLFETGLRGVSEQVEAVSGMDFNQFTRSMMLAQGGFAAFLQAAPNERAPLLEQITGTEIYSRISIRVHERKTEEQARLDALREKIRGIPILSPEEEESLREEHRLRHLEENSLERTLHASREALHWLDGIAVMREALAKLNEEKRQLSEDMQRFEPERERLERARRAATLEGVWMGLRSLRKQREEDHNEREKLLAELPGRQDAVERQAALSQQASQKRDEAQNTLQMATPLMQQVRVLDQRIDDRSEEIGKRRKALEEEEKKLNALEEDLRRQRIQKEKAGQDLLRAQDYLERNQQDKWLIGGLTGIAEQLKNLAEQQKSIGDTERERQEAETLRMKAHEKNRQSIEARTERQQKREAACNQHKAAEEALEGLLAGRLLREYRQEKESLIREQGLRRRIADLEEQRKLLEDGLPCPLCGATEHPFARGNVPKPDELDAPIGHLAQLIADAEQREKDLANTENERLKAEHALESAENLVRTSSEELQQSIQRRDAVQNKLERQRAEYAIKERETLEAVRPLGITALPQAGGAQLLAELERRLQAFQTHVEQEEHIGRQIEGINSEITRLEAIKGSLKTALSEKWANLAALQTELETLQKQRAELYGAKDPDAESLRLNRALEEAANEERRVVKRCEEVRQELKSAEKTLAAFELRLQERAPELDRQESAFQAALTEKAFTNEEEFATALLPEEHKKRLAAQKQALQDRANALNTRIQDNEAHLTAELDKKLTSKTRDMVETEAQDQENELTSVRRIVTEINLRLENNEQTKQQALEQQSVIEAQERECQRWRQLHDLIGSADGKKFRNFAQGLTFETVVRYANRTLRAMSDRYLLVRDTVQPLELNVIDNYQAGEIRSTKNLSGGESFLVSLALALGLSQMTSKKVRVDSLFLDEGFGTLDEEALDTALGTLASLQRDGRLIGIISHVSALKDCIGTQILVTPQSGGCSRISGPGCQKY